MGLKILHTADWHLDSPFAGFTGKQREQLKQEQKKIPGKIADLCRREQCDLVLLAGDIFDGPATRETVELVKRSLKACGVPVLVAPGNHDCCAPGSPWVEEGWPENVTVFTGPLTSVVVGSLDCRVYGAGFSSMDCPSLLEGFRAERTTRYTIAVLHGDPTQSQSPYNPITASQVKYSGLDYLALGHVHKAGAFRAGNVICAWPGCPMGRGWDETGEKGVCLVKLEDQPEIQPVSLECPQFRELTVDIQGNAQEALEGVLPAGGSRDFFRITLTGCGTVDLSQLEKALGAWPNLELVDHTEPPLDVWGSAGEDTLEGIYFQMLRQAKELNPEQAQRIQLAAEISRRLLEGREVTL